MRWLDPPRFLLLRTFPAHPYPALYIYIFPRFSSVCFLLPSLFFSFSFLTFPPSYSVCYLMFLFLLPSLLSPFPSLLFPSSFPPYVSPLTDSPFPLSFPHIPSFLFCFLSHFSFFSYFLLSLSSFISHSSRPIFSLSSIVSPPSVSYCWVSPLLFPYLLFPLSSSASFLIFFLFLLHRYLPIPFSPFVSHLPFPTLFFSPSPSFPDFFLLTPYSPFPSFSSFFPHSPRVPSPPLYPFPAVPRFLVSLFPYR